MMDLKHTKRDKSTERSSEQRATKEKRDAESKLSASVEERQVEHHTREETSFEKVNSTPVTCISIVPSKAPNSRRMTSMPEKFFAAHWNSAMAAQPTITKECYSKTYPCEDNTYS